MKSSYKKLGSYIELVSRLNNKLLYGETDVRGVSNNKEIIQTRANNEGRDLNAFYIVNPDEFIYNSRTSRMGDKVGLGYNDTKKTFITSFNNTVFRVTNEALLPKYLYMWFNRPEFDRYVRFHSWGSSTEIFSWEEMCNVSLPIPSITKQREIVKEYNVIQNRIALNQQLIQKLEETAQAIYKQWFVEREDNIEPKTIGDILKPKKGRNITRENAIDGIFPVVAGGLEPSCYHNEFNTSKPVVTISASGANAGFVRLYHSNVWAADCSYIDNKVIKEVYFAYVCLKSNEALLMSKQQGTGQPHIYPEHIVTIPVFGLTEKKLKAFNGHCVAIFKRVEIAEKENQKLTEFKDLLLSKLATIEN